MTMLMCSRHEDEVGAVRSELFKAGIRSEIRSNPVAAALQLTRLELWVEKESDYFLASQLYRKMQAQGGDGVATPPAEELSDTYIDVDELSASAAEAASKAMGVPPAQNGKPLPGRELEEATLLLEKDIEEILEREDRLTETCAGLRREVERLGQLLSTAQKAAEDSAAESKALQTTLDRELAARALSEGRLREEVCALQSQLKSGEETLSESRQKLELTLQQLQNQQAMVLELRKEIVTREQEWEQTKRLASKAQAELAVERQSRLEAEEKAEQSAQAREHLEKRLEEQKTLQERMRVSVGGLNSLRDRLQAKKAALKQ